MGGFKRLYQQTDIKGGWAQSKEASSGEERKKKKKEPSPTSLFFSSRALTLSPAPITHTATLSHWPLQCCAVPAGFQGAANGLRLIYMQLGWYTCRPSSSSSGAQAFLIPQAGMGGYRCASLGQLYQQGRDALTVCTNSQYLIKGRSSVTPALRMWFSNRAGQKFITSLQRLTGRLVELLWRSTSKQAQTKYGTTYQQQSQPWTADQCGCCRSSTAYRINLP